MEINQYAVTASEMKDLSFLDIDQYVSAGVYQSQKVPVSLVKAYMLSENIEQILLADMQALALAGDLVSLKTYLVDDGSTLYMVMAAGGVGNQIYQYAIDVTTGLFGTFDLVSGVFTQVNGNANIVEIGCAALAAKQSAGTLSLTTIYIVIDAPFRIAMKAEASNKLGANGTIIDLNYSGTVYYDVTTNNYFNGTIYDGQGNIWNGAIVASTLLGADCERNQFYQVTSNTLGDNCEDNTFMQNASSNILAVGCTKNTFHQESQGNTLGLGCSQNTFEQNASTNTLGVDCTNNIFNSVSTDNILGDNCNFNTFEQRAHIITLGISCINNTFGQYATSFTFGDNLQNVTIDAGMTGADYSDPTTYAFLYNKDYASTIFTDGTDNYHRYYDPANDRIVVTNLSTLNETYIGGGGATPDLQQVLDEGNISTTTFRIDDGAGNYVRVGTTSILTEDASGNSSSIFADSFTIQNPSFGAGTIKATTLANNVFFELPNKAAGTETFAMMSDITGGGDVVGPASAVDNNIATFDGTTGKLIQDGGTTIADINTNAVDRVTVKLAESITKGQAVYISGANGTNILVSKADNTTEATSSKTLGLLETSGATNAIVNVITSGLIDGINTSAATIGDAVWLGTSGNLLFGLANKPYAPAHLVYIGVVSRVSATVGEIIVKVQNGFELKEIHDVSAQTPSNKNGLFYNSSTSLWEARAVAATDIDANVSNTEFGYLDGVTSAIQTQINGKQATLVSGTNIKSVEGSTLLGSTALVISREIQIACSDETTALTAGTSKVTFRAPRAMVITGVRASLTTAQTSGSIFTVDINDSGTSILSTKLTIDNTEKTSTTAATPPVISDTAIADDAEITIDIDQIGDGTAKGLKVTILYTI